MIKPNTTEQTRAFITCSGLECLDKDTLIHPQTGIMIKVDKNTFKSNIINQLIAKAMSENPNSHKQFIKENESR